jgi:hypothetical protein
MLTAFSWRLRTFNGVEKRRVSRGVRVVHRYSRREEREAVEDDLNAIRDKLAAATIELQQREDELDLKNREIDDLIQEHDRVVEVVEQEWRGEVEEARSQVEELRDVCFLVVSLPFCVSFRPCYRSLPNAKTKQENYASTSQSSKQTPMTSMPSLKLHLHISNKKQKTRMLSSVLRTRRLNTLASKCMPSKRTRIAWLRSTNVSERRKQQSAKH